MKLMNQQYRLVFEWLQPVPLPVSCTNDHIVVILINAETHLQFKSFDHFEISTRL